MPSLVNKPRVASIDFGTNTFHALIVSFGEKESLQIIQKKRWFVFLDRAEDEDIIPAALIRAMEVANEITAFLNAYEVKEVYAVGTEVFRAKKNGRQLLAQMSERIGADIELIDGKLEAHLAYLGVNQLVNSSLHDYGLIDVGGGSTEMIRIRQGVKSWDSSFKIGLSVIKQKVNYRDYLTSGMEQEMSRFLNDVLTEDKMIHFKGSRALVFNGGSAELFQKVLSYEQANDFTQVFKTEAVLKLCHDWKYSSLDKRREAEWIPDQRKMLMPLFLAKVQYFISRFKPIEVVYSSASIKEGLIFYKK